MIPVFLGYDKSQTDNTISHHTQYTMSPLERRKTKNYVKAEGENVLAEVESREWQLIKFGGGGGQR